MAIIATPLELNRQPVRVALFLAPCIVAAMHNATPQTKLVTGRVQACRRDDLGYALILDLGPEAGRVGLRVDDRTQVTLDGHPVAKPPRVLRAGTTVRVRMDHEGYRAFEVLVSSADA
jgi:hypothetical protein